MMVILGTAEAESAVEKQAALAVGFTIAACGFTGGTISGASMNPARSIPPQLFGGIGAISWIYFVAPCAGALVASAISLVVLGRLNKGEDQAARGG